MAVDVYGSGDVGRGVEAITRLALRMAAAQGGANLDVVVGVLICSEAMATLYGVDWEELRGRIALTLPEALRAACYDRRLGDGG